MLNWLCDKKSDFKYVFRTTAPASNFSITSLPETVPFLPANSIFDYISYIEAGDPDVRNVPVQGNNKDSLLNGTIAYNPKIVEDIVPKATETANEDLSIRKYYTVPGKEMGRLNLLQANNLGDSANKQSNTLNAGSNLIYFNEPTLITSSEGYHILLRDNTQGATNSFLLLQPETTDENRNFQTRRQMLMQYSTDAIKTKLTNMSGEYLDEIPTYMLSIDQMDKFIKTIQ